MKKRYFLYCSYKGTNYHGWQIQPNAISIQEVLTKAFHTILRDENIEITGAGRTDTGVHASMMVAHFDVEENINTSIPNLISKFNSYLPTDIAIHDIIEVRQDAHARFDAVLRRYEYYITLKKDVFNNELCARIYSPINFDLMNKAAEILKGYEDFTSFSKLHTDVKTNNCHIYHAEWMQKNENEWVFTIEADRFLRNMVRAIVGTLLEVGREKISLVDFEKIICAKERCQAGTSVPAQGLFLVDIQYPESTFINVNHY